MEKFLLLILCSSFYSIRATTCDPDLPPCSDVHDIATIKCVKLPDDATTEDDACTITCGAENAECTTEIVPSLLDEEGNKIKKMDAGICKEKCREQSKLTGADPVCQFYRWEEEDEGKCILQSICGLPDIHCQPNEPDHRCMTGQIGCTEDGTTTCKLQTAVEYHHEKFHLICHGGTGDINIYSPADIIEISTGTVCYTIHKCDKWEDFSDGTLYYRKLAVNCTEAGEFESIAETPGENDLSKGMLGGTPEAPLLVEPDCSSECGDLVTRPDNLAPGGTELICDEPLDGNNLHDGNSCILICDNHWTMSITCLFNTDGTKDWMDQNLEVVTPETLLC